MITAGLNEDSFSFPGQLHENASRVTAIPKRPRISLDSSSMLSASHRSRTPCRPARPFPAGEDPGCKGRTVVFREVCRRCRARQPIISSDSSWSRGGGLHDQKLWRPSVKHFRFRIHRLITLRAYSST